MSHFQGLVCGDDSGLEHRMVQVYSRRTFDRRPFNVVLNNRSLVLVLIALLRDYLCLGNLGLVYLILKHAGSLRRSPGAQATLDVTCARHHRETLGYRLTVNIVDLLSEGVVNPEFGHLGISHWSPMLHVRRILERRGSVERQIVLWKHRRFWRGCGLDPAVRLSLVR